MRRLCIHLMWYKENCVHVRSLKDYSTDLTKHSYNIVRNILMIKIDTAKPKISSVVFHEFFFLVTSF